MISNYFFLKCLYHHFKYEKKKEEEELFKKKNIFQFMFCKQLTKHKIKIY